MYWYQRPYHQLSLSCLLTNPHSYKYTCAPTPACSLPSITVKEEASFVSQWFFDLQMQILLPHSKPVSSIIMPCLCYMCKNCDPGTLSSVFKHERVINTFKNLLIKKHTHTHFFALTTQFVPINLLSPSLCKQNY